MNLLDLRLSRLFAGALILSASLLAYGQPPGYFSGTVKAEWLDDGRKMRLLETLVYVDSNGESWAAPAGAEIDGASIPQIAWSLVGGPYEGKYRKASVIHDVACVEKKRPWEAVHEVFYWAMLAASVDPVTAKSMYAAVYWGGPRWDTEMPRDETADASISEVEQRALARAVKGSSATVIRVRPIPKPLGPTGAEQPARAEFTVKIAPPLPASDEQVKSVLDKIAVREANQPGSVTLEEIRAHEFSQ